MRDVVLQETISTREAARILHTSVRSIQLWTDGGLLKAYKTPGGHRRISRESVDKLIASWKKDAAGIDVDVDITNQDRLRMAGGVIGQDRLAARIQEVAASIIACATIEGALEQIGRLNALAGACSLDELVRRGEQHEHTQIVIDALVQPELTDAACHV